MLDAILGGVDAGTNLLSSATNLWAFNKNLKFQKDAATSKYQWAVEDMKKAGLNPVLAATGGFGSGGSPAGGASFGGMSGTNLLEKRLQMQTAKKLKEETEVLKKQGDKLQAETEGQRYANTAASYNLHEKELKGGLWEGLNNVWERFKTNSADAWRRAGESNKKTRSFLEQRQHQYDTQQEKLRQKTTVESGTRNDGKKLYIDITPGQMFPTYFYK